ncbi:spinocerebellar ataxia type 10 protein domain-containing protein [Mycena floridula]|nr:spinocerebellar ataxia type 10 protein domain-containing protein [Mycena floridula]
MAVESLVLQLETSAAGLDLQNEDKVAQLSSTLDSIALEFRDQDLKLKIGSGDLIWQHLRKLWRDLVRAQLTFWDGDDDDGSAEKAKEQALKILCASLGRFTRNLVAGVPIHQQKAFDNEPEVRRLLHYYTSWTAAEDGEAVLVGRILTQTLSNMVSGNKTLIGKLWDIYLNLPEDQVILLKMLTSTKIGARICISLFDDMVALFEAQEDSDGAKSFDVGYDIFSCIMETRLVPDLFRKLAISDEIITPHQTTLLKLLDSYLQSEPLDSIVVSKSRYKLNPMLAGCFFGMSSYAQRALRRALGNNSSSPLAELDVMLPKVCEALVLVTQCIITVTLEDRDVTPDSASSAESAKSPKVYFNSQRLDNRSLAESSIELLRLLDLFLPRINFGRPVGSVTAKLQQSVSPEGLGFSYLKRDIVRMLGILCHDTKAVQDRVRECGGIEVVMNLCVVDERNPYLREHALFTLHNLLKGNAENQAVVEEIKPMGAWDQSGVLQDTEGATRK